MSDSDDIGDFRSQAYKILCLDSAEDGYARPPIDEDETLAALVVVHNALAEEPTVDEKSVLALALERVGYIAQGPSISPSRDWLAGALADYLTTHGWQIIQDEGKAGNNHNRKDR